MGGRSGAGRSRIRGPERCSPNLTVYLPMATTLKPPFIRDLFSHFLFLPFVFLLFPPIPPPSVSLETLVPPSPPHASVVFQDPLLLLPRSRQIAETPNFMAAALDPAGGALGLLVLFALISPSARVGVFSRPDKETREKFYGNLVKGESRNSSGEGSIAEIFDRVLEKEFSENDAPEGKGFVPLIKIILLVSVWLHCGFVIAARSCTKDF